MTDEDLKALFEMAYLYAYGRDGSAGLRFEWKEIYERRPARLGEIRWLRQPAINRNQYLVWGESREPQA